MYLSHCDTGFTRMSSFVHDDVIMIATTVNQATDTISQGTCCSAWKLVCIHLHHVEMSHLRGVSQSAELQYTTHQVGS